MRVSEIKRVKLDESIERMITEALGVVDRVKDESLRIMHYIYEHMSEYAPKDGERFKASERKLDVEYAEDYNIPLTIKIYYFRTKNDLEIYRERFEHSNPEYSKDNNEITVELDVVNGEFDVFEFMYYLQHELHHGYQYYVKKRNCIKIKNNTKNYNKVIGLLNFPDPDERAAASAVYLWGTHEMAAYENGLYTKLLQNFMSKDKQPIQNVIHDTPFYRMYTNILRYQKVLENSGDQALPYYFSKLTGISKKKLKSIIKRVILKSQDAMTKAVAKAKIDYDDWIHEHGLGKNEQVEARGIFKPLTENRIRLYIKNPFE